MGYAKRRSNEDAPLTCRNRRPMKAGQIIISAPMMTTFGEHQFKANVTKAEHDINEYQLFLNYHFSHPDSSVYFFPINHAFTINHNSDRPRGGVKPNAELRWATWNKKSAYYLERSLEDLKKVCALAFRLSS